MKFPIDMEIVGHTTDSKFVVRFTAINSGKVIAATPSCNHSVGDVSNDWIDADDTAHWKPISEYEEREESVRGTGGPTSYYELPKDATELGHLIAHKHMEHGIGEMFCALYRLDDNGEYLRNLEKVKYYAEAAIEIHNKRVANETNTTI